LKSPPRACARAGGFFVCRCASDPCGGHPCCQPTCLNTSFWPACFTRSTRRADDAGSVRSGVPGLHAANRPGGAAFGKVRISRCPMAVSRKVNGFSNCIGTLSVLIYSIETIPITGRTSQADVFIAAAELNPTKPRQSTPAGFCVPAPPSTGGVS
jgi:hypothetical protein